MTWLKGAGLGFAFRSSEFTTWVPCFLGKFLNISKFTCLFWGVGEKDMTTDSRRLV